MIFKTLKDDERLGRPRYHPPADNRSSFWTTQLDNAQPHPLPWERFMPHAVISFESQNLVVRVLISSRDTGGDYTGCEVQLIGPVDLPLHSHRYEDQWVLVLEGHFRFQIGEEVVDGGPGTSVTVRSGADFAIASAQPGKLLVVARPGGLDLFLADAHAAQSSPSKPETWFQVLEKHGIVLGAGPEVKGCDKIAAYDVRR